MIILTSFFITRKQKNVTKPDAKTARLDCRVHAEVKDAAVIAAKAENRSLASYVEVAITEKLKKEGFLK